MSRSNRKKFYVKPKKGDDETTNVKLSAQSKLILKAISDEKDKCQQDDIEKHHKYGYSAMHKIRKDSSNRLSARELEEVILFLDNSPLTMDKLNSIPDEQLVDFLYETSKKYLDKNRDLFLRSGESNKDMDKIQRLEPRPEWSINNGKRFYARQENRVNNSLELAKYMCEIDNSHKHFICEKTNKYYVEGHHLIPLQFQDDFQYRLDIEENIVSLCAVCHKKMHHAIFDEKKPLIEMLYSKRKDLLEAKGIRISLEELKEYYRNFEKI